MKKLLLILVVLVLVGFGCTNQATESISVTAGCEVGSSNCEYEEMKLEAVEQMILRCERYVEENK